MMDAGYYPAVHTLNVALACRGVELAMEVKYDRFAAATGEELFRAEQSIGGGWQ